MHDPEGLGHPVRRAARQDPVGPSLPFEDPEMSLPQPVPVPGVFSQWVGLPGHVGPAQQIKGAAMTAVHHGQPGRTPAEAILQPDAVGQKIGIGQDGTGKGPTARLLGTELTKRHPADIGLPVNGTFGQSLPGPFRYQRPSGMRGQRFGQGRFAGGFGPCHDDQRIFGMGHAPRYAGLFRA